MFIIKTPVLLHSELIKRKKSGQRIGFVPTMGALHSGHMSLIKRAKEENDTVVCSIFVNPKQFDDKKDLNAYPRPIDADIRMLVQEQVDYLFYPEYEGLYGEGYVDDEVPLNGLDTILEGALRPGHFQGVAKVVKRFFEIVEPDKAYFGQKDFQQTVVIRQLITQFQFGVEMVVCPIIREENGLAMSSRNERLSASDRERAAFIYRSLLKLKERCYFKSLTDALHTTVKYLNSIEDAELEYLKCVNGYTMEEISDLNDADYVVAVTVVRFGGVRLLDNIVLKDA